SSTHHIARFWGLNESPAEKPRVATLVSAPPAVPADRGAGVRLGSVPDSSHVSMEGSPTEGEERQTQYGLNPNDVIAAAFQAAGLPVPATASASASVEPESIIAAALKAAGLAHR